MREATELGHDVAALVRDPNRATSVLPAGVTLVDGDLTTGAGMDEAVDGIDAITATVDGDARRVDYEGVLRILLALDNRHAHIVLMSAIGIANVGAASPLPDWKRRGSV
ncbi:NAD(P)H-binding protein [Williamsia sp. DF01-3]|nr:NAD(P)H-binding protein [Williamsia sp. DF01-3]